MPRYNNVIRTSLTYLLVLLNVLCEDNELPRCLGVNLWPELPKQNLFSKYHHGTNPTSKDNLEYDHVPTSLIELATGTSL
jgi:hypothetical protein